MEDEIIIGDSFECSSGGLSKDNAINLKMLIPSVAAGAIIGKGGESIGQLQKETRSRIRMTKLNDFYPGTFERVCLITGSLEAVRKVIYFVMDKIKDKPTDFNNLNIEDKLPILERSRQIRRSSTISSCSTTTTGSYDGYLMYVKIIVPNTTAGRIIGKGGQYVEQIKEETGAYVQISQKSHETKLPERCVTIIGDLLANQKAVDMILRKIVEDPYSSNFTTISYAGYPGPIANANPTGSPFATSYSAERNESRDLCNNLRTEFGDKNSEFSNLSNLNINSILNNSIVNPSSLLDSLKMALRNLGYSEISAEEISSAYSTLTNYGWFPTGNSAGLVPNMLNVGSLASYCSSTISNLGNNRTQSSVSTNNQYIGNSNYRDNLGSQYGPIGSNSETLSTTQTAGNNDLYSIREKLGLGSIINNANCQTNNVGFPCSPLKSIDDINFSGINNNSFGLGIGLCGPSDKQNMSSKQEIEVPESIVGAILGPKGRGIVEIQQLTNAVVQISKRGVFSPGTRNRLVDISGTPLNVAKAQFLIQHRLQQEEIKRAQQGNK